MMSKENPQPPQQESIGNSRLGILENRKAIIVMLFGITGVLGLPLLWLSPRFSGSEKLVYSVAVTFYTAVLIGIAVAAVWWAYLRIMGA
ncbi:MAG: hypothetical protein RLY14_104 [Planctomycetota bacterium]